MNKPMNINELLAVVSDTVEKTAKKELNPQASVAVSKATGQYVQILRLRMDYAKMQGTTIKIKELEV